jgi:23S rRNA (cytosine1962-C5)-methyltransferase
MPVVRVKNAFQGVFLFKKRVLAAEPTAGPGDLVAVRDVRDALVGYGLYNPKSEILVRMIAGPQEFPDADFWLARLDRAVRLRRDLLRLDEQSNAYRLVHAEADGLSGLAIDRLNDVLSMEAFSLAMYQRAGAIAGALGPLAATKHWIVRPGPKMVGQEGLEAPIVSSPDCPDRTEVQELGTRFRIRLRSPHKTGFFCDQRDNRKRLAEYCGGRSVLDLCCYTGGFALQAKRLGDASDVVAVELDEEPLEIARENANINQVRIQWVRADAFAYMKDALRSGRRFGVVVLDPPKLIASRAEFEEGRRKHLDLNRLATALVEPGGLLLTCCCAGLLHADEFERLVLHAARRSADGEGRRVQILARSGAAPDHPIADNCPETDYLKALWIRVL